MTKQRGARVAAALVVVSLVASCTRDVRYRMPARPDDLTGSITILLTQPASDLTVTINGVLVTRAKRTRKVHVDGVPAGYAQVMIAAGSGPGRLDLHTRVSIDHGQNVTIPVAAPDQPMTTTLFMGLLSAAAALTARAAYLALVN